MCFFGIKKTFFFFGGEFGKAAGFPLDPVTVHEKLHQSWEKSKVMRSRGTQRNGRFLESSFKGDRRTFCEGYLYIIYIYIIYIFISAGRKLALVEGLSHDLELAPDRFFMSTLRGRCGTVKLSPGSKFDKLRRYSQGEIWPEWCWQEDSRGKGLAVRRPNKTQQA